MEDKFGQDNWDHDIRKIKRQNNELGFQWRDNRFRHLMTQWEWYIKKMSLDFCLSSLEERNTGGRRTSTINKVWNSKVWWWQWEVKGIENMRLIGKEEQTELGNWLGVEGWQRKKLKVIQRLHNYVTGKRAC